MVGSPHRVLSLMFTCRIYAEVIGEFIHELTKVYADCVASCKGMELIIIIFVVVVRCCSLPSRHVRLGIHFPIILCCTHEVTAPKNVNC